MEDEAGGSHESESTSRSMEDILQLSSRPSAGDRLKMCCRPTYRIRKIKNKGAILILVWNFFVISVFYYLSIFHLTWDMYSITWGLTLPIAGWLADVYFGRYKVIRWSIWIMWITSVLVVASSVLSQLVESYYSINNKYVTIVLLLIMSVGFGGYQANIILLGIDQLQDASTDEITSFISWCLCSYFSGGITIFFVDICLGGAYGRLLEEFLVCVCLTVVVILTFAFDNLFLKEPITQNPFQLIYKVIKYAIKNKHPRCRSAFTYCEDELPSRIDFGKSKYGGPFTTEEVENVKTFLRLLIVIFVGSAMANILGSQHIVKHDRDDKLHFDGFYKCKWRPPVNLSYFSGAVLVPLYEFIFYPLLQKHLSCVRSYRWKLSVGVISQIARIIALMAVGLIARHSYLEHSNATIQCIFAEDSRILLSSTFDNNWMILPHLFHSVSLVTFATGAFEFICSQTPYSMRGLLFGTMYGSLMLYNVIGRGILQLFTLQSTAWGTGIISCGFWYLLVILLILILDSIMLCILVKWYKNRKREDVLPNEQIFAERYYSRN